MPLRSNIICFIVLTFSLLCSVLGVKAQAIDISGIVNLYSSVIAVLPCPNLVRLENPERFAAGDTVLLIQMKGATSDTTPGATFGVVTAMNRAGRFERNIIERIVGNDVYLRNTMLSPPGVVGYEAGQGVQLIRIPSYSDAHVVGTLTCPPWDGKTGGVLVFTVRNLLLVDADISVDGKGFEQEDGIARTEQNVSAGGLATAGRGGAWMTDGSGADFAFGGGGGAHVGCGGTATSPGSRPVRYGTGSNWIFMGGGGGTANSGTASGGRGGGIIIVDANSIIGDNKAVISSRGLPGADGSKVGQGSGGGGGGAGGTVFLTPQAILNIANIVVDGGRGGAAGSTGTQSGAGGGGGAILRSVVSPADQALISYTGGAAVAPATAGCAGDATPNNLINEAKPLFNPRIFAVVPDTTICAGAEAVLRATLDGGVSWTDGISTLCSNCDSMRVVPLQTTTYYAILTYTGGCRDTARVVVNVRPLPALTLTDPPPFCDSVVITAPSGFARYEWSTGDTTESVVVRTATTITLTVFDDLGCNSTASVSTRYRGDTVLTFVGLPPDGAPFFIDSIFPNDRACTLVSVRNTSDADLTIRSARMARGVEISVPQAQFPIETSPAQVGNVSASIALCASANMPGIYADTLYLLSACGEIQCALTATVLETKAYSRCRVRVTSDGEIEVLAADALPIVTDLTGRIQEADIVQSGEGAYFVMGLPRGVYIVRVGPTTAVIMN